MMRILGYATTSTALRVGSALAILVMAFFYQVTQPTFTNDHFDHLSKARQLLHGEYPVRDFFDPGRPLTVGLSAVVLSLSHDTLLGEAVLTMAAIAIGVMLVFWLTRRYAGSLLWGYWAAACTLLIEPRLYNYPKVLVCMVAIWLIGRYLDAPSDARALGLGIWGGVGFLFRHDLGVYLAVMTLAALLSRRARASGHTVRRLVVVGAAAALIAMPYFIYLQQVDALGGVATQGGEGLISAASVTWRPFVAPGGNQEWLRIDAENWLYYLFLLTPPIALLAWLARGVTPAFSDHIMTLAVLCMMLMLFLIRGNLDSRLPDVAAPSFVLTAWMLAALFDAGRRRGRYLGWTQSAAAVAIAALAAVSVQPLVNWQSTRRMARAVVRLPASLSEPMARLRADPLEAWERQGGTSGVRGLARWMRSCTSTDDRFLVFGYHPEVFFHARRLFAGGMVFFHAGYFSSPAEQELTVERLRRQNTPFVIVEESVMPALDGTYALVGAYVREHYRHVAASTFGGTSTFVIFQDNRVPVQGSRNGLPCRA